MNTTNLAMDVLNFTTGPRDASPLARALKRLAKDLDALVQAGHLQGAELDLGYPDTPCFLLNVASETPLFYVEMFVDEPFFDEVAGEDVEEEEGVPLNVLMNWLGSDTEPTFWQTAVGASEPDFGEVLSHILFMTEDHPAGRTTNLPKPI